MKITADLIKQLREKTGAGVMDAKNALEEADGDMKKAQEILKAKGVEKAQKKSEREIKSGRIFAYIHGGGNIAALVKIGCETDFVAQNEQFEQLGKEIAMQIASMDPQNVKELLKQAYIRDPKQTVNDLLTALIAKTGENITIVEFNRMVL